MKEGDIIGYWTIKEIVDKFESNDSEGAIAEIRKFAANPNYDDPGFHELDQLLTGFEDKPGAEQEKIKSEVKSRLDTLLSTSHSGGAGTQVTDEVASDRRHETMSDHTSR